MQGPHRCLEPQEGGGSHSWTRSAVPPAAPRPQPLLVSVPPMSPPPQCTPPWWSQEDTHLQYGITSFSGHLSGRKQIHPQMIPSFEPRVPLISGQSSRLPVSASLVLLSILCKKSPMCEPCRWPVPSHARQASVAILRLGTAIGHSCPPPPCRVGGASALTVGNGASASEFLFLLERACLTF